MKPPPYNPRIEGPRWKVYALALSAWLMFGTLIWASLLLAGLGLNIPASICIGSGIFGFLCFAVGLCDS